MPLTSPISRRSRPAPAGDLLTIGINRPNPEGHELIAQTVLQAFGASPDQLAKAQAVWLDAPGGATVTSGCVFSIRHTTLSLKQYADLKKVALGRKQPVFDLINEVYLESCLEALKAHGDFSVHAYPDDISNEADPIFTQKIEALIK